MYILMFIVGANVGILLFGLISANSREKELRDAYNRGRNDERASIIKNEQQYSPK